MMKLSKQDDEFLEALMDHWEKLGLLDAEQSKRLRKSYEVEELNWGIVARYAFYLAVGSIIVALVISLQDGILVQIVLNLVDVPHLVLSLLFALLSGFFFYSGYIRKTTIPDRRYSNELLFSLGILLFAAAIFFLGWTFEGFFSTYAPFVILASLFYFLMSIPLKSPSVWIAGFLALYWGYATESTFWTNDAGFFLGMNYVLRMIPFALLLLLLNNFLDQFPLLAPFKMTSYHLHLAVLGGALWLVTIFGNYGTVETWLATPGIYFLPWSLLAGVIGLACYFLGQNTSNLPIKIGGLLLLLLTLYTQFFRYLWGEVHHAFFFLLLGLSFWWIGRRAELFFSK